MENSQINEAQDQYEATCEDSQPTNTQTYSERLGAMTLSQWMLDQGDYLTTDSDDTAEQVRLIAAIIVALEAQEDGDRLGLIKYHLTSIGTKILENVKKELDRQERLK